MTDRRRTFGHTCVALLSIAVVLLTGMRGRADAAPQPAAAICGTGSSGSTGSLGSTGSAGSSGSRDLSGPGRTEVRSMTVGGLQRSYRIHFPGGYNGTAAVPLIVAFHGHAEQSRDFEQYSGLSRLPAIVLYPNGLRGTRGTTSWQGAPYSARRADDLAFTRALVATTRARECVDPGRIYAVGRSNGGGFVGMLACRMPAMFAAYATVSAAFYLPAAANCPGAAPVSLIDFHGTSDAVIHYGGGVRFGARYLSVDAALHRWITRAGCIPAPIAVPATLSTIRLDWPLCAALGREVVHYRIAGGTHNWPNSPGFAAADKIWQFFWLHPKGL
ncbi:PHB depolymerase family esterase [Gordonia sp. CPCC 205515]|uniref:alpha/beta hydrolase family esterase n=1 Tax=Gordonia sp. CPCC 205515 TaxID=3140791 RepID=UPI003AF3ED9D